MLWTQIVHRDDPGGQTEHLLTPPVPVSVEGSDGARWPGTALRWRGRWVYCTWSEGPGRNHMSWFLGEQVERHPG